MQADLFGTSTPVPEEPPVGMTQEEHFVWFLLSKSNEERNQRSIHMLLSSMDVVLSKEGNLANRVRNGIRYLLSASVGQPVDMGFRGLNEVARRLVQTHPEFAGAFGKIAAVHGHRAALETPKEPGWWDTVQVKFKHEAESGKWRIADDIRPLFMRMFPELVGGEPRDWSRVLTKIG